MPPRALTRRELREHSVLGSDGLSIWDVLDRLAWDAGLSHSRRAITLGIQLCAVSGQATCKSMYRSAHTCTYGPSTCRYSHDVPRLVRDEVVAHAAAEGRADAIIIVREVDLPTFERMVNENVVAATAAKFVSYKGRRLWQAHATDAKLWDAALVGCDPAAPKSSSGAATHIAMSPAAESSRMAASSVITPTLGGGSSATHDASLSSPSFASPSSTAAAVASSRLPRWTVAPTLDGLPYAAMQVIASMCTDAQLAALACTSFELYQSLQFPELWNERLSTLPAFVLATRSGRLSFSTPVSVPAASNVAAAQREGGEEAHAFSPRVAHAAVAVPPPALPAARSSASATTAAGAAAAEPGAAGASAGGRGGVSCLDVRKGQATNSFASAALLERMGSVEAPAAHTASRAVSARKYVRDLNTAQMHTLHMSLSRLADWALSLRYMSEAHVLLALRVVEGGASLPGSDVDDPPAAKSSSHASDAVSASPLLSARVQVADSVADDAATADVLSALDLGAPSVASAHLPPARVNFSSPAPSHGSQARRRRRRRTSMDSRSSSGNSSSDSGSDSDGSGRTGRGGRRASTPHTDEDAAFSNDDEKGNERSIAAAPARRRSAGGKPRDDLRQRAMAAAAASTAASAAAAAALPAALLRRTLRLLRLAGQNAWSAMLPHIPFSQCDEGAVRALRRKLREHAASLQVIWSSLARTTFSTAAVQGEAELLAEQLELAVGNLQARSALGAHQLSAPWSDEFPDLGLRGESAGVQDSHARDAAPPPIQLESALLAALPPSHSGSGAAFEACVKSASPSHAATASAVASLVVPISSALHMTDARLDVVHSSQLTTCVRVVDAEAVGSSKAHPNVPAAALEAAGAALGADAIGSSHPAVRLSQPSYGGTNSSSVAPPARKARAGGGAVLPLPCAPHGVGLRTSRGVLRGGTVLGQSALGLTTPIRALATHGDCVAAVDRTGAVRVHASDGTRLAYGRVSGATSTLPPGGSLPPIALSTAAGISGVESANARCCASVCSLALHHACVAAGHPDGSISVSTVTASGALRAAASIRFDERLLVTATGAVPAPSTASTPMPAARARSMSSASEAHTLVAFLPNTSDQLVAAYRLSRSAGALTSAGALCVYAVDTGDVVSVLSASRRGFADLADFALPSLPASLAVMGPSLVLVGYTDGAMRLWDLRASRVAGEALLRADPTRCAYTSSSASPLAGAGVGADAHQYTALDAGGAAPSLVLDEDAVAAAALADASTWHTPGVTAPSWRQQSVDAACAVTHVHAHNFCVLESRASAITPAIGDPLSVFMPLSSPFVRAWDLRASLESPFHVIDLGPKCLRSVSGLYFDDERVMIGTQHLFRPRPSLPPGAPGGLPPPAPMFHWNARDRHAAAEATAQRERYEQATAVAASFHRLAWDVKQSDLPLRLIPSYAWPKWHEPTRLWKQRISPSPHVGATTGSGGNAAGEREADAAPPDEGSISLHVTVGLPNAGAPLEQLDTPAVGSYVHGHTLLSAQQARSSAAATGTMRAQRDLPSPIDEHDTSSEEEHASHASDSDEDSDDDLAPGSLRREPRGGAAGAVAEVSGISVWHPHTLSAVAYVPLPSITALAVTRQVVAVGTDAGVHWWQTLPVRSAGATLHAARKAERAGVADLSAAQDVTDVGSMGSAAIGASPTARSVPRVPGRGGAPSGGGTGRAALRKKGGDSTRAASDSHPRSSNARRRRRADSGSSSGSSNSEESDASSSDYGARRR